MLSAYVYTFYIYTFIYQSLVFAIFFYYTYQVKTDLKDFNCLQKRWKILFMILFNKPFLCHWTKFDFKNLQPICVSITPGR